MITQELQRILDLNPKASIATRGYYTNYPVKAYVVNNNCALIIGHTDHTWIHCVGQDKHDLAELIKEYVGLSCYYYSVEEWVLPLILANGEEEWRMETVRYMLDPNVLVPQPENEIVPLTPDHTDYIFEHTNYRDYTDKVYIRDRLERDISASIVKDGKPIAWGLTHDDGALGFLHVLPEYRKKGYARDIVLARIAKKRELGLPVYCNIVPDNAPAIKLMESLGFKADRKIFWLKLKERET
jgi:GNAT superfamily N-acetyltransferase